VGHIPMIIYEAWMAHLDGAARMSSLSHHET